MVSILSKNEVNILLFINENGKITKRERIDISLPSFYMAIWSLREKGLVQSNSVNDKNQKIWTLTKKGEEVVKKLKELMEIMYAR